MSRPEKSINWDEVQEFLSTGCLGTEIAAYYDMHPTTFYRRVEEKFNMSFTEYSQEKKQIGDALIRRAQFHKALGINKEGDNTMLIWLGKQRLGQKEPEKTPEDLIDEKFEERYKSFMNQLDKLQTSTRRIDDNNNNNEQKSA